MAVAAAVQAAHTPNLPTKMIPTKNAQLKLSGKFPMDLRISSLKEQDCA